MSIENKSLTMLTEKKSCNSSKENLLLDSDICSWNMKKYPELKIPEVSIDIINAPQKISPLSKKFSKKLSKAFKSLNMSKLINLPTTNIISSTPKPKQQFNYLNKLRLETKISKKTDNFIKREVNQAVLNKHNEVPAFQYTRYANKLNLVKLKFKSNSRNPSVDNSKNIISIGQDIHFKLSGVFKVSRSKSPEVRKHVAITGINTKIFTAKTLEELLAKSKLPEISSFRDRRNRISLKKNNLPFIPNSIL